MASIYDWSVTAADNANSDSEINWQTGMAPSAVKTSGRAIMDRVAEYLADNGGALAAGGTANVITVTANSAFTAYADGLILALRITADNTDATTLNANSIGAKSVRKMLSTGESALTGAELQADGIYLFRYSTELNSASGGWLLLNPTMDLTSYATKTGVETLTNKTLTGAALNGTLGATTPASVAGTTGTFSGAISGTTGTFSGAVSGTTGTFSGAIAGSSTITANNDFISSTTAAILNTTGAGNVLLRPNGLNNTTGQLQVASTGNVTIAGTLTATSLAGNHIGAAKAWVNFNGTGTVAIRSSFNVASITDNGTGDYTINFTTAMADANYAVMICPSQSAVTTVSGQVTSQATGSCRFTITREGAGLIDLAIVSVVIFGN